MDSYTIKESRGEGCALTFEVISSPKIIRPHASLYPLGFSIKVVDLKTKKEWIHTVSERLYSRLIRMLFKGFKPIKYWKTKRIK